MPSPLVVPGVQVKTLFEPSPVLPGATGILGVVGITDRGPVDPTPIGNFGEFLEIFGPASRFTMPEVRTALANGVAQVVVARLAERSDGVASLELKDDEGEGVVLLRARAAGRWGNDLAVRVTQIKPSSGKGIKYVNLEVLYAKQVIETFQRLVLDEDSPDYLFDRINDGSRVIVALDPAFDAELPKAQKLAFAPAPAVAAVAAERKVPMAGGDFVVRAKTPGRAGNGIAVAISEAAGLLLKDADGNPSVDLRARDGVAGRNLTVSVLAPAAGDSTLSVVGGGAPVSYGSVEELVAKLQNDPTLIAEKRGTKKPAAITAKLENRVDIDIVTEGQETRTYAGLDVAAIKNINDPGVEFVSVPALPDKGELRLAGGRREGPAIPLLPETKTDPLVELTPANDEASTVEVQVLKPTGSKTVDIVVFRGADVVESFSGLSMDPDDPRYLINVLDTSATLRARDLFIRTRIQTFPRNLPSAQNLDGGTPPLTDAYQDALDRLEMSEEVDLVIASVANQLSDADRIKVQQQVVAHCTRMADVARNRIGLGSINASENGDVKKILDHADDVRSDHFILCAPAGTEAALAGLLGRQDYFQSPTFKTIASADAPLVSYTDAQLAQLVPANIAVITKKRKVGVIVVRGLLTSGRQVNVQRTANKSVRDTNAIANKYIGLLNNDGTRNALRQQIIAMFLQMERDGAIVPSTDGSDTAFKVDVYSTQADFANGIVRIDIAVRPVRAIDFIYATILVQN
ncbi:MAG TPA: phage tail sheath subtilisin-like domain-containing protein [Thermoanaerobaculia bacterium]|nr:phage tail sheath subtilisin-like domain-containing protein [Thermoanaerobaculia bacterium]